MWSFLKYVLATIVGIMLCCFILFMIGSGLIMKGLSEEKVSIAANSVMEINLSTPFGERTQQDPFAALEGDEVEAIGLNDILASIEKAETDNNIKGIFLNLMIVNGGMASIDEIRHALENFKSSGKFIIAYGEILNQKALYLASVADEFYLNPVGNVELKGFSSEITFYKKLIDRLEVTPEFFYVGKYKSFTEPYRFTEMSEPNREQRTSLLNDVYNHFLDSLSISLNYDKDSLKSVVDNLKVDDAQAALALKIVTGLKYYDEVTDAIKQNIGLSKDEKLSLVSIEKYRTTLSDAIAYKADKIAMVYAEGDIVSGEGEETQIGSERFRKALEKVREDDKVKAVVLRVNSPGGSALASEIILRELQLIKQTGKPVVVSMGDVAASGGYYISCQADSIFAQANTITGSIGVFGIFPIIDKFLDNKLGITTDRVKTGPYADFMSTISRPLTDPERVIIQNNVDNVYDQFLTNVSKGRRMSADSVHQIAQGRVWTGTQALANGLVDKIGNIQDAVDCAARMANISEYRISAYPRQEDPFTRIVNKLTGNDGDQAKALLKKELGAYYKYVKEMQQLTQNSGIQMRLPYEIVIE
ncbi:MAG: signal peptide peptidase SppA [Chitinophagales bacterium]|nr:signal peptide peptidase SppA [Bacteroidota bacterium]MCB9043626.1 signal peptide peptidase SppA [Chitinophagales bacterium]